MTDKENFLSRWSRMKREPEPEAEPAKALPEESPAEPASDAPADAQARSAALPAGADATAEEAENAPHPAELIDIDSLTKHSDFSAFVKKGVPAALQRKALRKLWTLDPVLANLDGLNDYENIIEDFGITDLKPGGSGWQVGRGFMTDKDFALINKRGGYKPPEADEAETDEPASGTDQAQVLADKESDDDSVPPDDDVSVAHAREETGDEFDAGDGDEKA